MMIQMPLVFDAAAAAKTVLMPVDTVTGVRVVGGKVVTVGARGGGAKINILHGATVVATATLGADGVEVAILPVTTAGADKLVFKPGTSLKVVVEAGTACVVGVNLTLDPFLIS